jgi:hypothetical protein
MNGLSTSTRGGVERAAEIAQKQRSRETLRDDWDAVGIGEIAAVLRSTWQNLNGALADVWSNLDEASVDLTRLSAYRGKNLRNHSGHAGWGGVQGLPVMASRSAVRTSSPCLRTVEM